MALIYQLLIPFFWCIPISLVAAELTFIGDRLNLDLYLVALINFGFRIFNNVALIRRHFI